MQTNPQKTIRYNRIKYFNLYPFLITDLGKNPFSNQKIICNAFIAPFVPVHGVEMTHMG
jgi:hypothetical protein